MSWFWGRTPRVDRLKRKGDVDGLVAALAHRDHVPHPNGRVIDLGAPVREAAVRSLAELGGPRAAEGLLLALDDDVEAVRLEALRALRPLRDPRAVDRLIAALASSTAAYHPRFRAAAVQALIERGDAMAARKLAAALVGRDGGPLTEDDEDSLRRLVSMNGREDVAEGIVQGLIGALESGIEEVRERAEQMLVWHGEKSVGPLVVALANPAVRVPAATVLGELKDSRAVQGLAAVLEEGDLPARRAATWALGEIRDPTAVEALLRLTTDPNYSLRSEAQAALDKLGAVAVALGVAAAMRPVLAPARTAPDRSRIAAAAAAGARPRLRALEREGRARGGRGGDRDAAAAPSPSQDAPTHAPDARRSLLPRARPFLRRLLRSRP